MDHLRVGVFEENEVFRRGVVACLGDCDDIDIEVAGAAPLDTGVAVAVVSPVVAGLGVLACPLVVCAPDDHAMAFDRQVAAVLPRATLEVAHLVGAVRAVGAGLRLDTSTTARPRLDRRCVQVLTLLSEGASTADVSDSLGYSVRTIKAVVSGALSELDARTRAEAVATAVRLKLI